MKLPFAQEWLDKVVEDSMANPVLGFHGSSIHALASAAQTGRWPVDSYERGLLHFAPEQKGGGNAFETAGIYAGINAVRFGVLSQLIQNGFTPPPDFMAPFCWLTEDFGMSGSMCDDDMDDLKRSLRRHPSIKARDVIGMIKGTTEKGTHKGLVLSLSTRLIGSPDVCVRFGPTHDICAEDGGVTYTDHLGLTPEHVLEIVPMGEHEAEVLSKFHSSDVHVFNSAWIWGREPI